MDFLRSFLLEEAEVPEVPEVPEAAEVASIKTRSPIFNGISSTSVIVLFLLFGCFLKRVYDIVIIGFLLVND